MTDTASAQLTTLAQALQAFERGDHTAAALSTLARQQTTLLAALPPRYSEVLLNLLDRLESSALFSEPVQDLLSSSAKNARWTNCKLVFSNLSQFFHNRLFFSNQAKLRSTTQRWGITLNVCSSLRLAICTATCPPRMSWTPWVNGRPT